MRIRLVKQLTLLIGLMFILAGTSHTQQKSFPEITDNTFNCISKLTKVRGYYVGNLMGNLDATLKVANSPDGGRYPAGSIIQLVPTEVMIKHPEGWNKAANDWEFLELEVSEAGSKIKTRGVTEVKNRFGGNCFSCHVKADAKWDFICETDHGCASIPLTAQQIAGIQQRDPRCPKQ